MGWKDRLYPLIGEWRVIVSTFRSVHFRTDEFATVYVDAGKASSLATSALSPTTGTSIFGIADDTAAVISGGIQQGIWKEGYEDTHDSKDEDSSDEVHEESEHKHDPWKYLLYAVSA